MCTSLTKALIPEPPNRWNRSYVGYLRIEDRPDFEEAKDIIRKLVPQELDFNRSWGRQDEGARTLLIAKVLETYPKFADYDGAWPIRYYSAQHLHHQRRCIPEKSRRRGPRTSLSASGNSKADAHRAHHVSSGVSELILRNGATYRNRADNSFILPAVQQLSTSSALGKQTAGTASGTHRGSREHACPGTRRPLERPSSGPQEVYRFLVALGDTLGYLLDRFQLAGITCRARLIALAGWTVADRDAFLVNELQLSAFERKVVSDGLNDLLRKV
ncbi:hypothetical protein OH77DRAFT_1536090 [Trametes cingulata]|nr:hypothetical protein OH77DRAFT_1536090 [Trametes cingulata]